MDVDDLAAVLERTPSAVRSQAGKLLGPDRRRGLKDGTSVQALREALDDTEFDWRSNMPEPAWSLEEDKRLQSALGAEPFSMASLCGQFGNRGPDALLKRAGELGLEVPEHLKAWTHLCHLDSLWVLSLEVAGRLRVSVYVDPCEARRAGDAAIASGKADDYHLLPARAQVHTTGTVGV